MRRNEKMFHAYNKHPKDGIGAHLINGDMSGIQLTNPCYSVNVYEDGTIVMPVGASCTLEDLADAVPDLYKTAQIVANDFKMLACRESCRESLIFNDTYSDTDVELKLKEWEEEAGCLVSLTEEQKTQFYNDLMARELADILVVDKNQISRWLYGHSVPVLPTGKFTMTVDKDSRIVTIDYTRDVLPGCADNHESYELSAAEGADLHSVHENIMTYVDKFLSIELED